LLDPGIVASLRRVYGSLTFKLIDQLMKPPSRLYIRVNTMRITPGELIDRLEAKGLKPRLDPYIEEALYFDVIGPNKIPVVDKRIWVDRYSAESVMIGANLYAPGVRRYDEFKPGELVSVVAPGNRVVAIVETVVSSSELKSMKKGVVGVNKYPLYNAPPLADLEEYVNGLFYPQSLPAMMTTRILNPKPGDLIVDMNSAPGGKTSHVIQYTKGYARVLAFERNVKKINVVKNTLTKLGLFKNTVLIPMDSRYIHLDLNLEGRVDKVIVDPPCSDLGVRPKIVFDKSMRDVRILSDYQLQFLKTASKIVKCNGLVVYSTCTLTFEEDEEVSLKALNYGLEPVDVDWIPYAERVEYMDLVAYRFSPLSYDMPGYYIVLFKKKC